MWETECHIAISKINCKNSLLAKVSLHMYVDCIRVQPGITESQHLITKCSWKQYLRAKLVIKTRILPITLSLLLILEFPNKFKPAGLP